MCATGRSCPESSGLAPASSFPRTHKGPERLAARTGTRAEPPRGGRTAGRGRAPGLAKLRAGVPTGDQADSYLSQKPVWSAVTQPPPPPRPPHLRPTEPLQPRCAPRRPRASHFSGMTAGGSAFQSSRQTCRLASPEHRADRPGQRRVSRCGRALNPPVLICCDSQCSQSPRAGLPGD